MKNHKGFTLIEVLVALALTAMLAVAASAMLVYGYKTFERIYSQKKGMEDLRFFRVRIEEHLIIIKEHGFLFTNIVPEDEVAFTSWIAGSYSSSWANKVGTGFVFYSSDIKTGNITRCKYEYDNEKILYSEWIADKDGTGTVVPLTLTDPSSLPLINREVVLNNVNVFQITMSYNGINTWELYTTDTAAKTLDTTKIVRNFMLKIYVDIDNTDMMYWFSKNYTNRSTKNIFWISHLLTGASPIEGEYITAI